VQRNIQTLLSTLYLYEYQGYGDQAIFVLDRLADEALRSTHFQWRKPEPPPPEADTDQNEEDEAEINMDKVEEEMAAAYSDEDEDDDDILHIDELGGPQVRLLKTYFSYIILRFF